MGIGDSISWLFGWGCFAYITCRAGFWGVKRIDPPNNQHFVTHEIYNMIFVTQYRFETDKGVTYEGWSVKPVQYIQ